VLNVSSRQGHGSAGVPVGIFRGKSRPCRVGPLTILVSEMDVGRHALLERGVEGVPTGSNSPGESLL